MSHSPGKTRIRLLLISVLCFWGFNHLDAQNKSFKVLVVASADPDHDPIIIRAKAFLEKIAVENNFSVLVPLTGNGSKS